MKKKTGNDSANMSNKEVGEVPLTKTKSPKFDYPKAEEKVCTLSDIPGVGPAVEEKLAAAGYTDLISIAVAPPTELSINSGVTEPAARKMISFAKEKSLVEMESGTELEQRRTKIKKVSTGSKTFDELIGGGFESGAITEIFGEYGSGKSQMAHILSVNVQKDDPEAVAVFIDTEGTFRPDRIRQLARGAGLDEEKVLENIRIAKAFNSDHQMLLVEKVEKLISEGLNVKLIVVDSLTAHFRSEYMGRGTLAPRQQKLNKHMHDLMKLADIRNVCVYVTNQVMAKPDSFFGDPTVPIGGHIVGHNSLTRIYLRKGKKGSRVAKLVDSPNLPDGECNFFVESEGLKDV